MPFCCIADSPPTAICLCRRMKITFEQAQFSAIQEQQIIKEMFFPRNFFVNTCSHTYTHFIAPQIQLPGRTLKKESWICLHWFRATAPTRLRMPITLWPWHYGWFDATQNNQMWLFLASNDVYKSDSAAVIFGNYYILNSWTIWQ